MEALETQLQEEVEADISWPKIEEQEMDRKAFLLWRLASQQGAVAEEAPPEEME